MDDDGEEEEGEEEEEEAEEGEGVIRRNLTRAALLEGGAEGDGSAEAARLLAGEEVLHPRFFDEQLGSAVGAIGYVRGCGNGLLTSIPL